METYLMLGLYAYLYFISSYAIYEAGGFRNAVRLARIGTEDIITALIFNLVLGWWVACTGMIIYVIGKAILT